MKKLTRHGNSWALVIERPVLDLLKIDPETTMIETRTDGESLVISPVRDARRVRSFRAAVERSHRKFGRAYRRLAG